VTVAERPLTRGKEESIDSDTVLQRAVRWYGHLSEDASKSHSTALPVETDFGNTVEL
jgi:hypothetical protein